MKRRLRNYKRSHFLILVTFFLWAAQLCCGVAWGFDSPGLSLNIYVEPGTGGALEYDLGEDPVKLFVVLKNESGRVIVTERDFSLKELHHSLIITDPNGVRHILRPSDETHKMPIPFFINEKAWSPAEKLAADWVKSTTIDDLREKVPVMFSTSGWYTIEAQQPFVRFASTGEFGSLGTMAVQDNANNWNGALIANKLQIHIKPQASAQLQTQVLDSSSQPPQPINQVWVRVFRKSDLPADYSPAAVWSKISYVLQGKSNPEGWVVWESASDVQCLPEDEYVVMAYYADGYRESFIPTGEATGWTPGCQDTIKTELFFEEEPLYARFSIFALNSVWLQEEVTVLSGNVGAQTASSGPVLSSDMEICLEKEVQAADVQIYGNRVRIGPEATVLDVFCNELVNEGNIEGEQVTPLALPVASAPLFLASSPGEDDVVVKKKKSLDLVAAAYKNVEIGENATLQLAGGDYHFKSLKVSEKASLVFLGPCTIRIEGRVECGEKVMINSGDGSIAAKDAVFYVGGGNGGSGGPDAEPQSVYAGEKCQIKAIIYAPNGTVHIGQESEIIGSLIAKDILIEKEAKVAIGNTF